MPGEDTLGRYALAELLNHKEKGLEEDVSKSYGIRDVN